MPIELHLHIEERRPDRLYALFEIDNQGEVVNITGAALELRDAQGQLLSPRMILPIAGMLTGPLATRSELRAQRNIPRGATLYGVVFCNGTHTETIIPADPCTDLEGHVRGRRVIRGHRQTELLSIPIDELRVLKEAFPWTVDDSTVSGEEGEEGEEEDLTDEIIGHYDLDPEDADFLRALMTEEDE